MFLGATLTESSNYKAMPTMRAYGSNILILKHDFATKATFFFHAAATISSKQ